MLEQLPGGQDRYCKSEMEEQCSEARDSSFDGFYNSSKNSELAFLSCLPPTPHRTGKREKTGNDTGATSHSQR